MGTPPACALCGACLHALALLARVRSHARARTDQYCPSNIVTTIFQLKDALYADFFTLVRLIGKCFGDHGIAGCFCQLAVRLDLTDFASCLSTLTQPFASQLTIQPMWRRYSTNKDVRCQNGDPFVQLLKQLDSLIVSWAEKAVNQPLRNINSIFNIAASVVPGLPKNPIPYLCLPTRHEPHRCRHVYGGGPITELLSDCEDQEDLSKLCFFARVKQICGSATTSFGESDSRLGDWMGLFSRGYEDLGSLEKEFAGM